MVLLCGYAVAPVVAQTVTYQDPGPGWPTAGPVPTVTTTFSGVQTVYGCQSGNGSYPTDVQETETMLPPFRVSGNLPGGGYGGVSWPKFYDPAFANALTFVNGVSKGQGTFAPAPLPVGTWPAVPGSGLGGQETYVATISGFTLSESWIGKLVSLNYGDADISQENVYTLTSSYDIKTGTQTYTYLMNLSNTQGPDSTGCGAEATYTESGSASFNWLGNPLPTSVKITDTSDIKDGVVGVQLNGPGGSSGDLVLTLKGKGQATQTFENLAPGAQTLDLALDDVDPDTYTSATATWTPGGSSSVTSPKYDFPKPWVYFEEVRYSQYNEPSENQCPTGEATAFLVTTKCKFTKIKLRPQFIQQTWINGTGTSEDYGILKSAAAVKLGDQSGVCKGKYPHGAVGHGAQGGNTFEVVKSLTGSCNTPLVDDNSAGSAAVPSIALSGVLVLKCKNAVNLDIEDTNVTKYGRVYADLCPICKEASTFEGANGHIDSYSSSDSCQKKSNSLGDLGFFYSSKTK